MPNPIESQSTERKLGYATNGKTVLVFDKLVSLLDSRHQLPGQATHDGVVRQRPTVLEMMQQSTVTPKNAVQQWGIGHPSYYIDASDSQNIVIRHALLDSRIPHVYTNLAQAQTALAELIMGRIIPGIGDFVYFGQPMIVTQAKATSSINLQTNIQTRLAASSSPAPIIH